MATINPYLNFQSSCEEAFNFYKSVFGGEFIMTMRFSDVPKEYQGDPAEANKIMHMSLPIGKTAILMGSDVPDAYGKVEAGSNNVQISVNAESKAEADKLYNGLVAGGEAIMPMADAFWGSYFGMLKDKYGFQWMVSFDTRQQ